MLVIPTSGHYMEVPLLLGLHRNYKITNNKEEAMTAPTLRFI
jgi:hypothetical protein